MQNKPYTEYLRCDLTDTEIADAARDLARANAKRAAIEQQKKEVDSQLKAEIAAQDTVIARLSTLINTGHEYRNIDCRIDLDTPDKGRKRIVRLDTGEEVAIKPMTDADKQMALELEEEARQESIVEEELKSQKKSKRSKEASAGGDE